MTTSKSTPAFLRYFSSRFKPFSRPLFLSSLGGLLIAGLAIYQYWRHPEWLQTDSESLIDTPTVEQQKSATTSPEDLAAAANLDNVDLLLKEIEQNKTLSAIADENKNQQKSPELKREESEFSRFQKQQKAKLSKAGQANSSNRSNPYSLGIEGGNDKILELLKPPSFTSYQSNRASTSASTSNANKTDAFEANIIPNPVGNTYLSNRNQLQQQTPATPVAPPVGAVNTGAAVNNNVAANSNPTNSNPAGAITPAPNGQNYQVNNNQPVNVTSSLGNRAVSASSLIQSRRTLPTPITNSTVPSSTTGINTTNPYLGTGFNSSNPYGVNNQGSNPLNGVNPNSANPASGFNGNNGFNSNNVSGNNNFVGTNSQPFQSPSTPGLTVRSNNILREGSNVTETGNDPNILQNNYRNSQLVSPNYNRSVPNGYQLQPQGYSATGFGQNSGLSGASNPSPSNPNRVGVSAGTVNDGTNSNSGQPVNNTSSITPFGTPSLQPSGILSTSEVGQ